MAVSSRHDKVERDFQEFLNFAEKIGRSIRREERRDIARAYMSFAMFAIFVMGLCALAFIVVEGSK